MIAADPAPPGGNDPLSDLLRIVRLDGAFFFSVEAAEPWSIETRAASELSPRLMPAADHLISYHVVTSGRCFGGLIGEEPVELVAGDVIVFPHGDAHLLSSGRDPQIGPDIYGGTPDRYLETLRVGGGGSATASFVCGFLGCDRRPFSPLLAALPRRIHLRGASNAWHGGFTRQVTEEARQGRAGAGTVLTRLAELMFIEVLRRYVAELPAGQTGWLAGIRDEIVGRVLRLLHGQPGHSWTITELARKAGSSRSSITKRFTSLVGQPPMQYLARWRMQVAANILSHSGAKVATIGAEVGYDSEAAFSRAFKRATGLAPGSWRDSRRSGRG